MLVIHSHCALRHSHVQPIQNDIRIVFRAVFLEGPSYADRLPSARIQGGRLRLELLPPSLQLQQYVR